MEQLNTLTPGYARQRIIEAMRVLERQALFVFRIQLTQPYYDLLGRPPVFEMARVTVGEHNLAMSDPEFFGFCQILFDRNQPTQAELDRKYLLSHLKNWRMWVVLFGIIVLPLLFAWLARYLK